MIRAVVLDACRFVLEDQGEARSSYWLASEAVKQFKDKCQMK
jgi:hypothetical protein